MAMTAAPSDWKRRFFGTGGRVVALAVALATLVLAASCGAKRSAPESNTESAEAFVPGSWAQLTGSVSGLTVTRNGATFELWGVWSEKLRKATYTPGASPAFSGWTDAPNPLAAGVNGTPAAIEYSGGVAIVAKDTNKKVWWRTYQRSTNTFSAWSQVGPTVSDINGSPAVSIEQPSNGPARLHVWGRWTDGNLRMTRYDIPSTTWSAWKVFAPPAGGFTNSPAVVAVTGPFPLTTQHELVVVSSTGQLWRATYYGGSLTSWDVFSNGFAGSPQALLSPGGGYEVFATSVNGGVFFRKGYHRNGVTEHDWTDWARLYGPPSGGFRTGVFPVFAASYVGTTHTQGLRAFGVGSADTAYHRLLLPGAPSNTALDGSDKDRFEDTATAIAPGVGACPAAGYPNGAAFVLPGTKGNPEKVIRYDASVIKSGEPLYPTNHATIPEPFVGTATWPSLQDLKGLGLDASSEFITSIFDNFLISDPLGGLTLTRQFTSRRVVGNTVTHNGRGTQGIFRSTDCGTTWTMKAVLDPLKFYDGAYSRKGDEHCRGFDRPELMYEPVLGRTYLTANACGDGGEKQVLLYSNRHAALWTEAAPGGSSSTSSPFARTSGTMAAGPDGTVFLFGSFDGAPILEAYDPVKNLFFVNNRLPGVALCGECETVGAPVGTANSYPFIFGSYAMGTIGAGSNARETLLRVAFPRVHAFTKQVEYVWVIKVTRPNVACAAPSCQVRDNELQIEVLSKSTIEASSPQGSVVFFTMLNAPANALNDGRSTHLLYWDETTRSSNFDLNQDFGITQEKAKLVRGTDPVDPNAWIGLSSSWPPGAWPGLHFQGDYRRGAVYWDSTGVVFLPMWVRFTQVPSMAIQQGRTQMAAVVVNQP